LEEITKKLQKMVKARKNHKVIIKMGSVKPTSEETSSYLASEDYND